MRLSNVVTRISVVRRCVLHLNKALFCMLLLLPSLVVAVQQGAANGQPVADPVTSQAASESPAASDDTANPSQITVNEEPPNETTQGPEKVLQEAAQDLRLQSTEAVEALKSGDLKTAAEKSGELFTRYGLPAVTIVVTLIAAYFLASFLARIAAAPLRKHVDETLGRFVGKLVFYLIMVGGVLGVLQYFGIGVASFAAVIAAAGFAIGLAFQGTLSNFAAGVMLLVFRPFKVGDVINAAGITASVYEIDLFTTTFDTPDNRRIIVPNSAIAGGTIENISHHAERRVDVAVGVDYSANLKQAREALIAAAESLPDLLVQGEGRGYQVVLGELGDSAVHWTVRVWVKAENYFAAKEQLTAAVKEQLDASNIRIPFPQMDIHIHPKST